MKDKKNVAFGAVTFTSYLLLVLFSHSNEADNLWWFYSLIGLCYSAVFGFFIYLWKTKQDVSVKFVFIWAVVFHLLGVFGAPLFEDDYYRYLWDAFHTVTYGSPYGVAPSQFFGVGGGVGENTLNAVPEKFQAILSGINYPDIPTIYGPTLQYSFLLAYFISPGEVWALQLVYSLIDLLLILVLLKMAPPKYVMLYAWSPLVFKEVLLTAHPDGLAVCLLMIAVYCLHRQTYYLMAIALAASLAAKVFAILFVPFLLFRTNIKVISVFLITLVVLYLPLVSSNSSDLIGLSAMAQNWEFNAALHHLLTTWFSPQVSKVILAVTLLLGFGVYFAREFLFQKDRRPSVIRGDMMLGGFLLCAPVINAWYLIWVLPFAVIHFSVTAWFASFMIMMAYMVGLNLGGVEGLAPYQQPLWVQPFEYLSILIVFLGELWFKRKN